MVRRPLGIVLAGFMALFALAVPLRAQTPVSSAYKEDVLNLSKWIDSYLERRWQELGVKPAPLADDAVFFRRLSLDLIGQIPDLIAIGDFIDTSNRRSDKHWNAVERYLASDLSARHFANFWRTQIIGRSSNQQFQFLYPQFEAWLEDRLKKHTPLNDIAAQIITVQNNGPNTQLGFRGGPGGQPITPAAFFAVNEGKPENVAGSAARVFLGVKIECAQCHKHPFAKWTREQFWEFAAFFSGNNGFGPNRAQPRGVKQPSFTPGREILIPEVNKVVKAKFLNGAEPKWGAFSDSRKVLADWMTAKENPYFARAMADHLWAYFFGVSLLEPILEPNDDSPVTHPELIDKLAAELAAHNFDQGYLIRALVHTKAYQRSSGGPALATKEDYHLFLRMPIRSLTPEQIYDSFVVATSRTTEATDYNPRFGNPFVMNNTPRGQFLAKFGTQDRRYDPQTSILQALFMMNGKFMADKTRIDNNTDLQFLVRKDIRSTERKVKSLFKMVLSRSARPDELGRLVPYLDTGGPSHNLERAYEDLYWALLNSPEFMLNY